MSDRFTDLPDEPLPRLDRAADALRHWSPARPDAADVARSPAVDAARAPDLRSEVLDRAGWIPDAAGDPAVAARSASDIPQAGDPVDVATGDVVLFQDDVSLPGVLPLIISRAYRSSWRAGRWFGRVVGVQLRPAAAGHAGPGHRRVRGRARADVAARSGRGRARAADRAAGDRAEVAAGGGPDGAFTVTDPQAGLVWRFEAGPERPGELPLVSVTDRAGRPDLLQLRRGRASRPGSRIPAVTMSGSVMPAAGSRDCGWPVATAQSR